MRVSYRVNNKLFVGVPVRVCTNPDCVVKHGAEVYDHRQIRRPPSETDMKQAKPTPEISEMDLLTALYNGWVSEGKPGYFSDYVGRFEDVADAD